MHKPKGARIYLPVILIFVIINSLCIMFKNRFAVKNIDADVILGANLILFIITILTTSMHSKAIKNTNPNVFVRSVMGATIIKFFVIAIAVFIYMFLAGESRSVYAVIISMGVYVIYTVFELQTVFRLNRKGNGH
ncbi:MAG: hypothetical protein ACTHJ5_09940 [Ilyomonas sp.]